MSVRQRLLAGAGLCFLLFVALALMVGSGRTLGLDLAVLRSLRMPGEPGRAIGPGALVPLASAVTFLGIWQVRLALAALVALALMLREQRREAVVLAIAWLGGAALLPTLKVVVGRARPDLAWRLAEASHDSFPSGHAMGAAILYPMAAFLIGRVVAGRRGGRVGLCVGLVLALAIGLSRVFLGVHWLSDVAAGWLAGAAWTLACLGLSARPRP